MSSRLLLAFAAEYKTEEKKQEGLMILHQQHVEHDE